MNLRKMSFDQGCKDEPIGASKAPNSLIRDQLDFLKASLSATKVRWASSAQDVGGTGSAD
jgi:hypothetical protein